MINIDEIFAKAGLPSRQTEKTDTRGVCYYNTDNKENKENKVNTGNEISISSLDSEADASLSSIEGTTPDEQVHLERSQEGQELLDSESGFEGGRVSSQTPQNYFATEDPALTPEMVDRCLLTFYDNGEQPKGSKKQRYKLGITINPIEATGDRWEFIGNLNKDRRIFTRNMPEKNRDVTIAFADNMRSTCKEKYNSYPLIGKVHANAKWQDGEETKSQKEDGCAVAVYWTGNDWHATVMLWDYIFQAPLFAHNLSPAQSKKNVKAVSGIIYGPNSITKANDSLQRKPTFRQMRSNKNV
tara:strand:+ start:52 stop:948 length:897 start_codon:yes stop_codon:yes gene_type:complete